MHNVRLMWLKAIGTATMHEKPDAASFLGYLTAHDAHHGGQIALLARQCGHPLSKSAGFGIREWGTRRCRR